MCGAGVPEGLFNDIFERMQLVRGAGADDAVRQQLLAAPLTGGAFPAWLQEGWEGRPCLGCLG